MGEEESKNEAGEHVSPLSDPKQLAHFKSIIGCFLNYTIDSMKQIARIERDFHSIQDPALLQLLKYDPKAKVEKLRELVAVNQKLLDSIVVEHLHLFETQKMSNGNLEIPDIHVPLKDVIKMRSVIKQFVREWAAEGKPERDQSFSKILQEFFVYFPESQIDAQDGSKRKVKVLHPGSGLGRMPYECAKRGYASQGNEFTYFMLLGSNFMLNRTRFSNQLKLYPYIHSFSNMKTYDEAFTQILLPDECPAQNLPQDSDFSMVAGDFVEVYASQKEEWDAILTCFFLDTGNSILNYISTIFSTLRPGGVWINFGPLLYHFTELEEQLSIELSWEEVRYAVVKAGFQIKRESFECCNYSTELDSMMKTVYNCAFFTAVKPLSQQPLDL